MMIAMRKAPRGMDQTKRRMSHAQRSLRQARRWGTKAKKDPETASPEIVADMLRYYQALIFWSIFILVTILAMTAAIAGYRMRESLRTLSIPDVQSVMLFGDAGSVQLTSTQIPAFVEKIKQAESWSAKRRNMTVLWTCHATMSTNDTIYRLTIEGTSNQGVLITCPGVELRNDGLGPFVTSLVH